MLPDLAPGRFTRQLEMGDADAVGLVVEDDLNSRSDGHVLLFLRLQVGIQ